MDCDCSQCTYSQVPDDDYSLEYDITEPSEKNKSLIKRAVSRRSRKDRLLLTNVIERLSNSKIFIMKKDVPHINEVLERVLKERGDSFDQTNFFLFRTLPNGFPEKLRLTEYHPSVSYYFSKFEFMYLDPDVLAKVEEIFKKQRTQEIKMIVTEENRVREEENTKRNKSNKDKPTKKPDRSVPEPSGIYQGAYWNDQNFIGPILPVRLFRSNTQTFPLSQSRNWISKLIKNPIENVSAYWNKCYFQWIETKASFPEEYSVLPYIFINDHVCGIHRDEAITYAEDCVKLFLTKQTFPPLNEFNVELLANQPWYEEQTHKESKQQICYYHEELEVFIDAFRENILVDVGFQNRIYMRQLEVCGRMMTCFCPCSRYMSSYRKRTKSEYFFNSPHMIDGESFQAKCGGLTEGNYTPEGFISHLKSEISKTFCPLHYFTLKYLERLYSHLEYFCQSTFSMEEYLDNELGLNIPNSQYYFFDRVHIPNRTRN